LRLFSEQPVKQNEPTHLHATPTAIPTDSVGKTEQWLLPGVRGYCRDDHDNGRRYSYSDNVVTPTQQRHCQCTEGY
jgi:hypothetical protein